jgi:SYP7 family syntaxin
LNPQQSSTNIHETKRTTLLTSFLQLTPEAQKQQEEDSSLDEFQRVKKRCARQVQEIRKAITERDELLEKVGGTANKQTVEMSAKVRVQLRELRADAEKLKDIQLAEEKKAAKTKKPDAKAAAAEKVDHRKEVVDLVFSHIDECETLEKKRLNLAGAATGGAARSNLLANGGKAAYAQVTSRDL